MILLNRGRGLHGRMVGQYDSTSDEQRGQEKIQNIQEEDCVPYEYNSVKAIENPRKKPTISFHQARLVLSKSK